LTEREISSETNRETETGAQALDDIRKWSLTAARAASAKKGEDIVVLEVGGVLAITDVFVITSAPNARLVKTIVDEVEKQVKADDGPSPLSIEGRHDAQWVLLDYGDFVVHVFLDEVRRYYDLERLWSDVPRIPFSDDARVAAGGE
jgi:ribosome-associated protein